MRSGHTCEIPSTYVTIEFAALLCAVGRSPRVSGYGLEELGHRKIARIYEANGVAIAPIAMDGEGIRVDALEKSGASVVHLSPSHHYPTGIVMPIGRRQELLRWAGQERYILEDDYDSEFRFVGRPIQTLFSIDENRRVIYLNTFSKTIAPSIRISYMILPPPLLLPLLPVSAVSLGPRGPFCIPLRTSSKPIAFSCRTPV